MGPYLGLCDSSLFCSVLVGLIRTLTTFRAKITFNYYFILTSISEECLDNAMLGKTCNAPRLNQKRFTIMHFSPRDTSCNNKCFDWCHPAPKCPPSQTYPGRLKTSGLFGDWSVWEPCSNKKPHDLTRGASNLIPVVAVQRELRYIEVWHPMYANDAHGYPGTILGRILRPCLIGVLGIRDSRQNNFGDKG